MSDLDFEPGSPPDPPGGRRGGPTVAVGLAPMDRPWTLKEAAYALAVSTDLVRKAARRGELPHLPRFGRTLRFKPEIVLKFRDGWRPERDAMGRPIKPPRGEN
jgi:excisionase family DNA binding protein